MGYQDGLGCALSSMEEGLDEGLLFNVQTLEVGFNSASQLEGHVFGLSSQVWAVGSGWSGLGSQA